MVFVELPKFKKTLEELETIADKWIYFLKEAPSLEMIPDNIGEVEEINRALTIANRANLTEKELEDLHHQEVFFQDQQGSVIKAREEGLQQGREEGREEGIISERLNLIQRLLERKFGELPTEIKESLHGLSPARLEDLSLAMLDFASLDDLIEFLN